MKHQTISYSIVLIGSGNVAKHMGSALKKAGHKIEQVYSPTLQNAKVLANELNCAFTNKIDAITEAQIYIVCIKDDTIIGLAKKLRLKKGIVVHTAGSVEMNVLKATTKNYGVLYPLQTFSQNKKLKFKHVPLCLEANNEATLRTLHSLADSLSKTVINLSSEQRKLVHLAAVFACNFTNHLFKIAEDILAENKIPFKLLEPLITESVEKAFEVGPTAAQTGPAVRDDKRVIAMHESLLKNNTELLKLYKSLTASIIKNRKK